MPDLRERLEAHQVLIYFFAIGAAAVCAFALPGTSRLEQLVNPALALMLFVTFLQVPMAELRRAFTRMRFLGALLSANFVAIPLAVAGLIQLLPDDPLIRLGVAMVLLAPCIDYVVTFSHLGGADAKLLLAATPLLLIVQMGLLPVYLELLQIDASGELIRWEPFLDALIWLIAAPLALAAMVQKWAGRSPIGSRLVIRLGLAPVPATALVLFIVVAAVMPQIGEAMDAAVQVAPIYVAFAVLAPLIGWWIARGFGLDVPARRSVAFSAATRNSLVVLPLALAVPGAAPLLPAVIVAQTMVELLSELVYIRLFPRIGREIEAR